MKKDIAKLLRQLRKDGWAVKLGSKHWDVRPPGAPHIKVVIPVSPSDYRTLLNVRADLRRALAKATT